MKRSVPILIILAVLSVLASCKDPKSPQAQDNLVVGKLGDGGAASLAAAAPTNAAQAEDDAAVPIVSNDAVRGNRLAAVTLVIFSDFQCPYCSRLVPTIDRLFETYGPDNLRIVFKNEPLPFHQWARMAAEVGQGVLETSGNDAFWRFHNLAFQNQKDLGADALIRWAVQAGADEHVMREGMEAKRWAGKVDRDNSTATARGASGTPSSFIDGIYLSGAQPYDKFKAIIDAELTVSKSLADRGVPKDSIYTRLAAQNFKNNGKDDDDDDDKAEAARMAAELKAVRKIPLATTSPMRGPAGAQVTIVEFSDFQCPFCKRVEPTIDQIRQTYGDKVRIVWRDMPLSFHPRAEPAAELARFAQKQQGDAGFWKMHDALYASQPALEDSDLERVAGAANLDVTKAMAAVHNHAYKSLIDADSDVGDDFNAAGTPNFFINGRHLVGAQPFDKFKPIIDEEIAKADALLKSGTTKDKLYDTLVKDGTGVPDPAKKGVAPAPATDPWRGDKNGKVVIQEFADFQCPFCGRVDPTIEQLLKDFPGKIKVVWRDHPLSFHADAPLAAEAGREAYAQKGTDGFSRMSKLMFAHQQDLKRGDLDGYAQTVGLDMSKFATALDKHTHKAAIDAESQAAEDAGMTGTPAFLIGPYYLSGAQPIGKFRKLVNLALVAPASATLPPPTPSPVAAPPAPGTAGQLGSTDLVVGKGAEVKSGDKVTVDYVGSLVDGTKFDASLDHGSDGFTFTVGKGSVIKGWDQGLIGMKVGGKRKLTIPPDLAYGDRGAGSKIPPKSTLVFEIELRSIN